MEKEYYDAQIKYINEIRSIRHDIQAHMIVLQYYLESENYEKAKAYLGDMKRCQNMSSIVMKDTGHDLVNAIVSDCFSRSSKSIEFEIDGVLPEHLSLSEYDICTLFSNLFSNAREACEKLVYTSPVIRMEVRKQLNAYIIAVQNPIEWKVMMKDSQFISSKSDKEMHGFGTKNIIKVVKQNGGKIEFLVTEGMFRVELVLPKEK